MWVDPWAQMTESKLKVPRSNLLRWKKKSHSLRSMSKWLSLHGMKSLALFMVACPELPQKEFLQMASWEKPTQTSGKKISKDKKREMPQEPPSSPSPWPAPSDLNLDQRTGKGTGWCVYVRTRVHAHVCVCVCCIHQPTGLLQSSWRNHTHIQAHTFSFTHIPRYSYEQMWKSELYTPKEHER